jgi:hypothetical protein
MPLDQLDPQSIKAIFKAAAATYKHGLNILPDSDIKLFIKPVISTTKPMIKFIWRW